MATSFAERYGYQTRVFLARHLGSLLPGWSVPVDQVQSTVRLKPWHVDATGAITDDWLRKTARSAAQKCLDAICGLDSGRVDRVSVAVATPRSPVCAPQRLRVITRYCGRSADGTLGFRHVVGDLQGNRLAVYTCHAHVDRRPEFPAFPSIRVDGRQMAAADGVACD